MENNPILSICIPTNGIVEWVMPTIECIYEQKVDEDVFEVIVTDNGDKDDLEKAVKKIQHKNFHYYRTSSKGFTNQIDAFEKCTGVFCKMLNHRSRMLPGSIDALLSLIRKYQDTKPILYCANGKVKGAEIIECANIDEFVRSMGYWVSLSAGTGVWKSDMQNIREKKIDQNFPHTLFLFDLRNESEYVIWNQDYESMADGAGKGGYDLFNVFAVRLLDIVYDLYVTHRISNKTFSYVKRHLYGFLCFLYLKEVVLPTKHTFIIQNIKPSIRVYYSSFHYYFMLIRAYLLAPLCMLKTTVSQYLSKQKQ